MVVWGGRGNSLYPSFQHWRTLQSGDRHLVGHELAGAPPPRYEHTAVWTGQRMIVWGGSNGSVGFNDGSRYDLATDTWQTVSLNGAHHREPCTRLSGARMKMK